MLNHKDIMAIYQTAQPLIKIELPDKLWEGGLSTFKVAVDTIRSNQEQLSTMMISVSREHFIVKRALKQINFLLKSGVPYADIAWPAGLPNLMAVEELEQELAVLWDNLKLMHSELTRARSDLRSKIALLEAEVHMGPSGRIPRPDPKDSSPPGVKGHQVTSDHDVTWDN